MTDFDPQFVESVEQMAANMNAALNGQMHERTGAMPLVATSGPTPIAYVDAGGQVWPHLENATIIIGIKYLYTRDEVLQALHVHENIPLVVQTSGDRASQEAVGLIAPVESAPAMKGDRAKMLAAFEGLE